MHFHLHRPGNEIGPLPAGGFILTHGNNWISKLIRFGERLQGRGYNWNHAAFVIGPDTIAEALGKGVTSSPIQKYKDIEFLVVWDDTLAINDVKQMQRFARSVLKERARYGYLEIFCLGITMLLRLGKHRLLFGMSGSMICSGFVSETLTRSGAIFPVPPGYMTPADLAQWATDTTMGAMTAS